MSHLTQQQRDNIDQNAELAHQINSGQKQFQLGYKNDPAGTTQASQYYPTNNGGLFSIPGVMPRVFSAIMRPITGLLNNTLVNPQGSASPGDASLGGYDSPLYETVTGVTAGNADSWTNQPNAPCDDPPVGGLLKACIQTSQYGRYSAATNNIDIRQLGRAPNRGVPMDLNLMNGLAQTIPFVNPTGINFTGSDVLLQKIMQEWMIMGISLQRLIAPHVFVGDPNLNKAGGGAKQMLGLDYLINTGKVDALNGTPCPAMDSDIKAFNYDRVNGTGRDIVQYIDMILYYLEFNAAGMSLDPVTFKLVMRPELFDELVKVYPIRYYQEALLAMNQYTNGRVVVAANEATDWRDDMRNNLFLPVRGKRYRVVLDNTIPEDSVRTTGSLLAGQYASDIYILPDTVLGGIPAHFFEFFNLANPQAEMAERLLGRQTWTTDMGMFRWGFNHRNGCFNFWITTEPRQLLLTPQLAGRITDVAYQPLQHTRDWDTNSVYFANGGSISGSRTINRYYTERSSSTPVQIS